MKQISLHKRGSRESGFHYLSVGIGYQEDIVFTETNYYPPLTYSEEREIEHFVVVQPSHKPLLLTHLQNALIAKGTQATARDEEILALVQRFYTQGHLQSLADVEQWLLAHQIPFEKSVWHSSND